MTYSLILIEPVRDNGQDVKSEELTCLFSGVQARRNGSKIRPSCVVNSIENCCYVMYRKTYCANSLKTKHISPINECLISS